MGALKLGELQPMVKQLFEAMDADASGSIDEREWKECASNLVQISEDFQEPADAGFARLDQDGDGTVTLEEFSDEIGRLVEVLGKKAMAKALKHTRDVVDSKAAQRAERCAKALFRLVDQDQSGSVDTDELKWLLQKALMDDELDVDELLFEIDDDYSGEVELNEFMDYFQKQRGLVRRMSRALSQQGESADRVLFAGLLGLPWLLGLKMATGGVKFSGDASLSGEFGHAPVDINVSTVEGSMLCLEVCGIVGEANVDLHLEQKAPSFYKLTGYLGEKAVDFTIANPSDNDIEVDGKVGKRFKAKVSMQRTDKGLRVGGLFGGPVCVHVEQGLKGKLGEDELEVKCVLDGTELQVTGMLGDHEVELTANLP